MTDAGPFDDCDHPRHPWKQTGRCVYCDGCGIRLYQGTVPVANNEESRRGVLDALMAVGAMPKPQRIEGGGVAGPDPASAPPEEETPAAAAPPPSPTDVVGHMTAIITGEEQPEPFAQAEMPGFSMAAYQAGAEAAKAEMANARKPLIVGALDPFNVRQQGHRLMRQSMLNQADVCNLRVAYDFVYGGGHSVERILGTGYHAGAAKFLETQGTATEAQLRSAVFDAIDVEMEVVRARQIELVWERVANGEELRDKAWQLLNVYLAHHVWDLGEYEVVAVEVPWYWPLNDRWAAHGSMDFVLRNKRTGVFIIGDHKTASKPWKKGKEAARATNQPAWYQAFWPALYRWWMDTYHEGPYPSDVVVEFAFDIMTYDGKFERRWANRNMAEIQRAFDKANILATIVDNNGPWWPNQSHFLCDERWCDHYAHCPFGAGVSTNADAAPVFIDVRPRIADPIPE